MLDSEDDDVGLDVAVEEDVVETSVLLVDEAKFISDVRRVVLEALVESISSSTSSEAEGLDVLVADSVSLVRVAVADVVAASSSSVNVIVDDAALSVSMGTRVVTVSVTFTVVSLRKTVSRTTVRVSEERGQRLFVCARGMRAVRGEL